MIAAIGKAKHFRFFDSGDMYHIGLANKILELCEAMPQVSFWIPTRMHKIEKFKPVLAKLNKLPNVVARFSSDSTQGKRIRGKYTSTIVRTASQVLGAHECPATIPGNKPNCKANNCTACWDKDVKTIAYHYH